MCDPKRTVAMPAENFQRLIALIVWYADAPNEEFGDRFHEKVTDIIADLLPTIPELEGDDATHYYNTPEAVDGRLYLELCSQSEDAEDFYIELVAE